MCVTEARPEPVEGKTLRGRGDIRMKLQLSNSDFYGITCPLGDEDKWGCYLGSVIANGIDRFYRKVCADVTGADIDYPNKLCAH